jgi:hypothetical protein
MDHSVQDVRVQPEIQFHLHRGDLRDAPRFFDLADVDVAQTDALDESLILECRKRADACRKWGPRVDCVKLIQLNALPPERTQARFAGRAQVTRSPVRLPLAAGSSKAPFRGDNDARAIAGPGVARARDESLVVPDLGVVQAIRVSRVEERHPAIECGMQDSEGPLIVALGFGGQSHAAEAHRGQATRLRGGSGVF